MENNMSVFLSQNQELYETLLADILERCQNHLKLFSPYHQCVLKQLYVSVMNCSSSSSPDCQGGAGGQTDQHIHPPTAQTVWV